MKPPAILRGVRHIHAILAAGVSVLAICAASCSLLTPARPAISTVQLVTLDPGHFHASLVQKSMYPQVNPVVHIYAPAGDDLNEHLKRIAGYNNRADDPTRWNEIVYTGPDYFDKMLHARTGNVVVVAGNNTKKTDYILRSVEAGFNVLADKPMVITPDEFPKLQQAFAIAAEKHVLLYDIMTERFEVNTQLQRALSQQSALFGEWTKGTPAQPAITMESVHFFSKTVSGAVLKRPAWFFDVRQQGEALPDVGMHLVDLVQWEAFPDQALNISDVQLLSARRWATPVPREAFKKMTGEADFPAYLRGNVTGDTLQVYENGAMTYRIRGVLAQVTARWEVEAVAGGDTHYSLFRGTRANLVIRQGAAQNYKPVLYVGKPDVAGAISLDDAAFDSRVNSAVASLQAAFPGIGMRRVTLDAATGPSWMITVPDKYDVGHEAHFAQVTNNFLQYLREGKLPAWEVPNMLTRCATLMKAYELSR